MTLHLSRKTEQKLRILARFHETKPTALGIDIIEMYLHEHTTLLRRAERWAKAPNESR